MYVRGIDNGKNMEYNIRENGIFMSRRQEDIKPAINKKVTFVFGKNPKVLQTPADILDRDR